MRVIRPTREKHARGRLRPLRHDVPGSPGYLWRKLRSRTLSIGLTLLLAAGISLLPSSAQTNWNVVLAAEGSVGLGNFCPLNVKVDVSPGVIDADDPPAELSAQIDFPEPVPIIYAPENLDPADVHLSIDGMDGTTQGMSASTTITGDQQTVAFAGEEAVTLLDGFEEGNVTLEVSGEIAGCAFSDSTVVHFSPAETEEELDEVEDDTEAVEEDDPEDVDESQEGDQDESGSDEQSETRDDDARESDDETEARDEDLDDDSEAADDEPADPAGDDLDSDDSTERGVDEFDEEPETSQPDETPGPDDEDELNEAPEQDLSEDQDGNRQDPDDVGTPEDDEHEESSDEAGDSDDSKGDESDPEQHDEVREPGDELPADEASEQGDDLHDAGEGSEDDQSPPYLTGDEDSHPEDSSDVEEDIYEEPQPELFTGEWAPTHQTRDDLTLSFFTSPSTESTVIRDLAPGTLLHDLDEAINIDGIVWGRFALDDGAIGWLDRRDVVEVTANDEASTVETPPSDDEADPAREADLDMDLEEADGSDASPSGDRDAQAGSDSHGASQAGDEGVDDPAESSETESENDPDQASED